MDISQFQYQKIVSKLTDVIDNIIDFASATKQPYTKPRKPRIKRSLPQYAETSRYLRRLSFRQTNCNVIQKQNEILKRRAANVVARRSRRINAIIQ